MAIKLVVENKKARFDFELIESFEAGLVLQGSEVKSIRNQQVNLKDSYIAFRNDEAYLQNAHISVYKAGSYNNHEPERLRKILMHKHELEQLQAAIKERGLSCVPVKMYFKNGKIKLEIALAKGKKKGDKREAIKTRDANLEMKRQLKSSKR